MKAVAESGKTPYIVNCSSREVYGEPTSIPVSETANLNPINSYGESKLKAEELVQNYVAGYNLRAITLRPSNVYGSTYDLPNRAIPKFIRRALTDQPIEIYGGCQTIDFIHISDIVEGIFSAVSKLETIENIRFYDVFNLISGVPHTLNDVIQAISDYSGKDIKTVYVDPRRCDVQRFVGDPEKARIELGFKAKMRFNKGISMTVDQYQRFFDNFSYGNPSAIESSITSLKEEVDQLKILQVIHGYPPLYMAGSEVYSYNLSKELAKYCEVHVFTRMENPFEQPYVYEDTLEDNVHIRRVNNPERNYTLTDNYLNPDIDAAFIDYVESVKPDVVHIGHLSHLSTNIIRIAKERFGLPVVFTLHDFWLYCFRGQLIAPYNRVCNGSSTEPLYAMH